MEYFDILYLTTRKLGCGANPGNLVEWLHKSLPSIGIDSSTIVIVGLGNKSVIIRISMYDFYARAILKSFRV